MKAFEFLLLLHPTPEGVKNGETSNLLTQTPQVVLAKDAQGAAMLAGRAIPQEHLTKIDRIEVAVRPF